MVLSQFQWALALAGSVSGAAIRSTTTEPRQPSSTEPCALASIASASYLAANPEATAALIQPSVAYACLKSVPVDTENDLALLDWLEPYVNWQSTLEQLAAPPKEYLLPGVDVLKGIGQIRAKLAAGQYANQVDFGRELYQVVCLPAPYELSYLSKL